MKYQHISYIAGPFLTMVLYLSSITAAGQNGDLLNIKSIKSSDKLNSSSIIDSQMEYIQKLYSAKVDAPKEIINGKEYESYYIRSQSKPLLFADKGRTATIFTRSRRYNNLTLQYDTFLDEVVYTDTSRTLNYRFPQIALNKDVVDGFNFYFEDDSLIFRYFRLPECINNNLKEGFYEIAYQGKSKYVIKHKSSFYDRDGLNEYEYSPENYIRTGDVFYRVKSKGSLLKLFGEKSGEVKRFLHISRIRIRQADKKQFISILKFYDSLLTSSR